MPTRRLDRAAAVGALLAMSFAAAPAAAANIVAPDIPGLEVRVGDTVTLPGVRSPPRGTGTFSRQSADVGPRREPNVASANAGK